MGTQRVIACIIACVTTVLVLTAAVPAPEVASQYELKALPVPEDMFLIAPVVSLESGTIGAQCSASGTLDEGTTLIQFEIDGDALRQRFSTPIHNMPRQLPRMLLDAGLLLISEHDPDVEWNADPRVGKLYKLVDTSTGAEENITPANLTQTTPWPYRGGMPVFWSDEYGLTMFIYERDTRQVVVWQGRDTLEEVQRTPLLLALGGGYIDGRYTRVELTDDGVVLAYDWATGRLEESNRHAALGAEIAKVIETPQKKPVRLALAQEIAVFKWENYSVYTVISADGSRRDIEIIHGDDEPISIPDLVADETTPFSRWNELTDEEKEAAARDLLLGYERDEGLELPPDVVSAMSYITTVDDSHVGIVDTTYQRLIVIGLAEAE